MIHNKNKFLIDYGMYISFTSIVLIIVLLSNFITMNKYTTIEIVRISNNSYLGLINNQSSKRILNNLQDSILLQLETRAIAFKVDSISDSKDIIFLSTDINIGASDVFKVRKEEEKISLIDIIKIK